MSPDELQRLSPELPYVAVLWVALINLLSRHLTAFTVLGVLWFVTHLHATATNLRDNSGVDRLTWLFTIWTVPFGVIFYWRFRDDTSEARASLPPPDPHYSPPASSPQDTASAVTAALAEEARLRKQRRG